MTDLRAKAIEAMAGGIARADGCTEAWIALPTKPDNLWQPYLGMIRPALAVLLALASPCAADPAIHYAPVENDKGLV